MKPAHVIAGLGVATVAGGFALTFYNHGFVGVFAIGAGLIVACLGFVGLET